MKKLKLEQLSVDSFLTSLDGDQKETVQGGTDTAIVCSVILASAAVGSGAIIGSLIGTIFYPFSPKTIKPTGHYGKCEVTERINCPSVNNYNCDLPL